MAASAFSPQLSSAWSACPSYLWEVPGKPVIVRVAFEMVDRLEREVAESIRSLEMRGSEIGGLLLGAVQRSRPFEVSIQSYEVVPSEYMRGPLYQLSPRDLERFEDVLEQRVGAGLQIVGFFRSHTRKGLGLDTEDVAIFNRFFPKRYQVALLAKPFATNPTTGAIFIREGCCLRRKSSYKEFPFRTDTVEGRRASPTQASNPRAGQPSAVGGATIISSESRGGVFVPPPQVPGSEAAGPAAFEVTAEAIAAPAQAATALTAAPEPQPVASPDRQTTSQRSNGNGKLVPAVRTARPMCRAAFGKLEVTIRAVRPMWIAGASATTLVVLSGLLFFPGLHLDHAQLRHGGIVYLPSNSDINFQLTITGKKASQMQSESVRVLRFSPWATPELLPPSPPKPVPKRTMVTNVLALMSPQASKRPGAELARATNEAAPLANDLAQSTGLTSALDLPDAPSLTFGQQAQTVLIPGNMADPAKILVSLFHLLVAAPLDTPEPRVGGRVREAQILTKRSPEYPLSARQARVQGSVIVQAVIDVDGHVKLANAVSGPPVLQNAAVAAVKRWVYNPATLHGTAVESETRIELHFTLY
jgi:TonB family protein